jgi:hypothetical protein
MRSCELHLGQVIEGPGSATMAGVAPSSIGEDALASLAAGVTKVLLLMERKVLRKA